MSGDQGATTTGEAYHGGLDVDELRRYGLSVDSVIDFSSNILPSGPSLRVRQAVHSAAIDRYPDRECHELRQVLAKRYGVDAAELIVGNGCSELIHALASALIRPQENVLIIGPTFSEYERATRLAGGCVNRLDAKADTGFAVPLADIETQLAQASIRFVWLCNPNNPTGQGIDRGLLTNWLKRYPDTLFVVDESYIDFATQTQSLLGQSHANLVVLRSMTKAYGIAGLRLGFAWMPEDKLRQLIDRRIPWTVNSLAQAAGLAALEDQDYYAAEIEQLHQAKREFVDELAVHGFQAVPSDTGFFLLPVASACRAREALLREAMVVRDCRSFGLDGYLRIAVLQPASNRRLTQALVRWTSGGPVPELPTQEPETPMATRQAWPNDFCQELHQLFRLRRDVRHFRPEPLPAGALRRWVEAACLAPSVGLSQPWRFVTIDSPEVRARVIAEFETQNRLAAEAYDDVTAQHYQSLKLAGLREAPEHLAVLVDEAVCEGRGLGRATMPETIDYSVVAAIQNLWLAARAEGVGIGWVSILRPAVVAELIAVPPAWRLIAYLCIGYPQVARDDRPLLERQDWEYRQRWEHIWHQR